MTDQHRTLPTTPVRASVYGVTESLTHVQIHGDAITSLADDWAEEEFELPAWRAPVFPNTSNPRTSAEDVIDFFFLGNSLNFAFRDFETGENFTVDYNGTTWEGAFAMWACLKRRYDDQPAFLSGSYLSQLTRNETERLFEPTDGVQIPMLEQRHSVLQRVGETLVAEYDGHFSTFLRGASECLYDNGDGIVDRLLTDFQTFEDLATLDDETVRFDKRAQLAPAMLYGRFQDSDRVSIVAPSQFTVFADYNLPNVLRSLGVIEYDSHLQSLVDGGHLIEAGSRAEVELRVATIVASDRLIEAINAHPAQSEEITGAEMDYKLFSMREQVEYPVHKTRTTAY